jgi:lipoprotein-anchoring transpeptidase ErfK/SrfK
MNISPITKNFKIYAGISILAGAVIMANPNKRNPQKFADDTFQTVDTFEYIPAKAIEENINNTNEIAVDTTKFNNEEVILPPPEGSSEYEVLKFAPSPSVKIMGENKNATFVVNLSNNVLYHYDENGEADCAYRIASGKPQTPTHTGIRVVTHVETYPYRNAPPHTKRHKNPRDYGPKIIMLNKLNPETGEKSEIGEFIHGNRNSATLGKYVSHGCMRMDNTVIKELAANAKRGDIVIITK